MGWVIPPTKHRIVVNRIHLGLMLLRSLNLLWIALSRQYWIKERAPIKRFLSVMSWAYLVLCYWQSPLPTSACCSRWWLCSEWLALQQSTWGLDPTWAKHPSSWEPCVRIFPKLPRPSGLNWSIFRNKAVSDGAISFYLDHFVRTRVSKLTYGDFCHIPYDPNDSSHTARVSKTFVSISGSRRISDYFDIILPLVTFPMELFVVPLTDIWNVPEHSSLWNEGIQEDIF